uniref:Putative pickpocket 13 n=1 Tax=Corethrella appendiculata TaxID=1370023 RepID=U5ETC3_9DIPT
MKFFEILKEYCLNSTLHGVKFIAEKDYTFVERIFWIICILTSWIGSAFLIQASLEAFRTNAITFVVETSYLDWNTDFPAVSICESRNTENIQEVSDRLWGTEHDFSLEEILNELAYFRGESYHTIHECGSLDAEISPLCIVSNFSHYAQLVRSPCDKILEKCFWNNKEIDCCKYFRPIETEMGICYAINSKQSKDSVKYDMISNKFTGPGKLKLVILQESVIYLIGKEEIPHLLTSKSNQLQIDLYISYKRMFSIHNIENDPETRETNVEQRNCRFDNENDGLEVYKYYSYSACSLQCRKNAQLKFCNCTNHLMPNTSAQYQCNITGFICLNDHYEQLSVIIPKWAAATRKGIVCDCLPSCTEVDINIVHDSRENLYDGEKVYSEIEIELSSLPSERYKRNVIRGRLDLVVSIGGTTGLFVGASLLSFVEIFYYFTIRPYGKYYTQKKSKN